MLIGQHVILRDEKRDTDEEDAFRWLNLEEWNYYDEPDAPFQPIGWDEFERQRSDPKPPAADSHRWQVDTCEGKHIGWVTYYQLDEQASSAYVGIDLPEPETWGQSYGTEAISLLIDYLFKVMGLKFVKTTTWTGNQRMKRVAEKCDFKEVARRPHRANFSVRGEPLEFVEYMIARSEWQIRQ